MCVEKHVQLFERRKPLRWCKTTRTEREGSLAGFLLIKGVATQTLSKVDSRIGDGGEADLWKIPGKEVR